MFVQYLHEYKTCEHMLTCFIEANPCFEVDFDPQGDLGGARDFDDGPRRVSEECEEALDESSEEELITGLSGKGSFHHFRPRRQFVCEVRRPHRTKKTHIT